MNLTESLQNELNKLNSSVKLINSYSGVKINTEYNAISKTQNRIASVNMFSDSNEYFLQIEDKELIVATLTTKNLNEIAKIIDFWLTQNKSILSIQNKIIIDSFYYDLLMLTEKEILQKRWINLSDRIKNKEIEFEINLFKELKRSFWKLYPFFSHDFLWFSNIIGIKNDNYYTPLISSINGKFEIRNESYGENVIFSSSTIEEIIQKIYELTKYNNKISRNPLK